MLSSKETLIVLEKYFDECIAFWKRRGFDDKKAFKLSISDIEVIRNDPFSPRGRILHPGAKYEFVHSKKLKTI